MSRAPVVLASATGGVGRIELNRPQRYNCLTGEVADAIAAALDGFEADKSVRAVLVGGRGKHFCTGADLDGVKELRAAGDLAPLLRKGHRMLARLEASPLPVVGAVHGLCLAGGIELMLACDVVFAARSARIGDQHAQYGLVPGWGGSQRLPRIVGLRRALELMFSARWLDAEEAHAWGLVNHLADDAALEANALAYCADLARRSAGGLAVMKRLARLGLNGPLDAGLQLEIELAGRHLLGAEAGEGLAAFEARREPEFE